MKKIPVFKAEIEDGIAEVIQNSNASCYSSAVKVITPSKEIKEKVSTLPAIQNFAKATNQNQIDLFYIQDILVTAGVWNSNQDIFLTEEVWAARHTPTDKPFNLEHSGREIIGHITEQYAVATNGDVIPDDTALDELPDQFDILSTSVIYRFFSDADYKKKINEIITEIESSDKWKVSMEALFSNYDYGIQDGDETIVIARNKATANLSKYLSAYGGKGVYNGKKIGRVLRDITFSGKGLTENPANERSVIVSTTPFQVKASKKNNDVLNLAYTNLNEGENIMNEQDMKNKITELEQVIASNKQSSESLLKEANDKLTSVASKVAELEKSKTDLQTALDAKVNELKELSDKYSEASTKLKAIEDEKKKNDRIDTMVNSLSLKKEVASELYESLASLNDEQFGSYVEKSKKHLSEKVTTVTASKVVENAVPEKNEAPVINSVEADVSKVREKIKEYIKASKGVTRGDK